MSLTITKYPNSLATWSYWNAVHNGIIFQFLRKDFVINTITELDPADSRMLVRFVDPIPTMTVGTSVYINSGVYVGIYTVAIYNVGYIVCEEEYISDTIGGWANSDDARKNYYLEAEIYRYEQSLGVYKMIGVTQKFTPSWEGYINADISEWLLAETKQLVVGRLKLTSALSLEQDEDFDYTEINIKDNNRFIEYNFKYRECYIGVDNSFSAFLANDWYAVKAAKQLGEQYGGNMAEYIYSLTSVEYSLEINSITGTFGIYIDCITTTNHLLTTGDNVKIITGDANFNGFYVVYQILGVKEFRVKKTPAPGYGIVGGTVEKIQPKTAKFLSQSEQPEYIDTESFSLSFIYNESVDIDNVKKIEEEIDINGNVLAHNEYNLDVTQKTGVNHITLQGGYSADVAYVDVWLETGVALIVHYVKDGYVEDDYVV